MSCKLFDMAAFGDHEFVGKHYFPLAIDRLRRATILDASELGATFRDWQASTKRDPEVEFKRANSPFKSVYVHAGIWANGTHLGMHVEVLSPSDPPSYGKPFSVWQAVKDALRTPSWIVGKAPGYDPEHFISAMDRGGQVLRIVVWSLMPGRKLNPGGLIYYVSLSPDGEWLAKFAGTSMTRSAFGNFENDIYSDFPMFAFQLMHCRNIVVNQHEPYRPKCARLKGDRVPKLTYHTLSISDTLIKREGQEPTGEHPGKAKHVCRGNFAHYTEENKLFGKYTGMFWRPMHIRGSAKHGIVGKEYELAGASV
jgi:hypothetical protein